MANPPYDARAVANAILDLADASGIKIYATTLLKVLYFAHGWHLAQLKEPLVGQPFEAWKHGPVIRVVYDQINSTAGQPIRLRLTAFDALSMSHQRADAALHARSLALLQAVLGAYGSLHPYTLSDITHEPGSPWDTVWQAASAGLAPGARLNDGEIRDYFLRQNVADVVGKA